MDHKMQHIKDFLSRNHKVIELVKDYLSISFGLTLYVCSWVLFMWPKEITGGGVSGIGSLINYATRVDGSGGVPVFAVYLAINIVLLAIGIRVLGSRFGAKTVFAIGITTLLFSIVPKLIPQELIVSLNEKNSELICSIMAGIFAGAGIGISFNSGGSSGGTDIIALIITKYRNISPGRIILYFDFVIIGSSYFVFHDINKVVYGFVMIGVVGYTIDLLMSGSKQSLQIFIFSKKYATIADRLTTELRRGVTALNACGWYTKEPGTILLVVVRKYEANDIYRVIKEEDPQAFISVSNTMGVFGLGFDEMKGKKPNKEARNLIAKKD